MHRFTKFAAIALIGIPKFTANGHEYIQLNSALLLLSGSLLAGASLSVFLYRMNRKNMLFCPETTQSEKYSFITIAGLALASIIYTIGLLINHSPAYKKYSYIPKQQLKDSQYHCSFLVCTVSIPTPQKTTLKYINLGKRQKSKQCIYFDTGKGRLGLDYLSNVSDCNEIDTVKGLIKYREMQESL